MDFYKRLNYSLGNEDWLVEAQALQIKPRDKAICVTASGDRSLHLLMTDCASILSVDMNPIQTYLLELKLAAIKELDYEKYLTFLGCYDSSHRISMYHDLQSSLSSKARIFWNDHLKMIKKGIIYQGFVERFTYATSYLFKLFKQKHISILFSFTDLNEQRDYIQKEFSKLYLKQLLDIFLNKRALQYFIRDPGLIEADESINPANYIYKKIENFLRRHLARKSPLLQLILLGKILPDAYFPYLTYDGYHKIRSNPERLNYVTDNIVKVLLESEPASFDCFSMSDIASYMPQEAFLQLLAGIQHTAKPGARFCIREFMSKRKIPPEFKAAFLRNPSMEQQLEDEESNFVYRFFVGQLV